MTYDLATLDDNDEVDQSICGDVMEPYYTCELEPDHTGYHKDGGQHWCGCDECRAGTTAINFNGWDTE